MSLTGPGPDEKGNLAALDGIAEARAHGQREAFALESAVVAGEQPAHDLPRLPDGSYPTGLVDTEGVEPGSGREPEEGSPARRRVERRDLARDLDGVQRERVEARRPDARAAGRRGNLEQRRQGGLVPEVVVDRDHREAGVVRKSSQSCVLARALVRL